MKTWYYLGIECPNCGNDLEVLTDKQEIPENANPWVGDSDEVRCCECEFKSHVIADENDVYVDDGNINEIENY